MLNWWNRGENKGKKDEPIRVHIPVRSCRHVWTRVEVGQDVLLLGSRMDGAAISALPQDVLAVDLTGLYRPLVQVYGAVPCDLAGGERPVVVVDWPDGSIVDLPRDWWETLVGEFTRRGALAVRCEGGHGRTGTAAAIIVGLVLGVPDPVSWIREHYCKEAVETQSQIEYVSSILGRPIAARPSRAEIWQSGWDLD